MAHRLRVIAGTAGGLHLFAPKGARPTTDRVKESLFASLGGVVVDANVLDLFAGSGALGIEALSRGARRALFVDDDRDAEVAIRRNLTTTRLADRAEVRRARAHDAIASHVLPGDVGAPFDLVFLDPPYDASAGSVARLLAVLDDGWVDADATVVVERRSGSEEIGLPPRWRVTRERTHGDTLTLVLTV